MIPQTQYAVELESVTAKNQPSRTYRLDISKQRVTGYIDGLEAVKQAILLILNTERFRHQIYSWNYGNEISRAIGKDFQLAQSNVKRYIKEALLQDERITDVEGFVFENVERNTLAVSFTVHTVFGDLSEKAEVKL